MKKTYCDRCGCEMVQNDYLMLKKNFGEVDSTGEFFDICPKCRESFFGWIGGQPAGGEKSYVNKEQPKPADKPAAKPSKPSTKKNNGAKPYTISNIAGMTAAPSSTIRRHLAGFCPTTYGNDKDGHEVRYYHLTDEQLNKVVSRIKNRKQGKKIE